MRAARRGLESQAFLLIAVALPGATLTEAVLAQDASDEIAVVDGRTWSLVTSAEPSPWEEAREYCDTLEAGGFSDWRLPLLEELEALFDADAPGSIRGPFMLEDCCAWSSTSLADLAPERKGQLPDPGGPPESYFWGFLFEGGIAYYSNGRFPDGIALCTRE